MDPTNIGIVGMEGDKKAILGMIFKASVKQRSFISILGMGGRERLPSRRRCSWIPKSQATLISQSGLM